MYSRKSLFLASMVIGIFQIAHRLNNSHQILFAIECLVIHMTDFLHHSIAQLGVTAFKLSWTSSLKTSSDCLERIDLLLFYRKGAANKDKISFYIDILSYIDYPKEYARPSESIAVSYSVSPPR